MEQLLQMVIIALIGFILLVAIDADAQWSPGEQACFDKVDAREYVAPVVQARYKRFVGLRGCTNFQCLTERARPSRKVLQVFHVKNLARSFSRGNYGNLGWARQNVALIRLKLQIPAALDLARGIEYKELLEGFSGEETARILKGHDEFVAEVKCIRKTKKCRRIRKDGGFCEGSFNEAQPIP